MSILAGWTVADWLLVVLATVIVMGLVGIARGRSLRSGGLRALWSRLPILVRTLGIAGVIAIVLVIVLSWNDGPTLTGDENARARAAGANAACARPQYPGGMIEYTRFKQCLMATGTSREDADYRGDLIYCNDMMTNRYGTIPRDSIQIRFAQDPDWYQKEYLACMAQRGHEHEAELLRKMAESRR